MILLIACVNVASLLLVRATEQRRDAAVRLALGARPADIVRQRILEAVALVSLGTAAALLLAWNLRPLVLAWLPGLRVSSSAVSPATLGFAALLALAVAALCGAAPSWASLGRRSRLVGGERVETRGSGRLRGVFVATQVTLCLPALIGSFLLLRSIDKLYSLDTGFNPASTVMAGLDPEAAGVDAGRIPELFDRLIQRLEAQPDVAAAALASAGGLSGGASFSRIQPADADPDSRQFTAKAFVSASYFDTLRLPLLAGRRFHGGDTAESPQTAIVNRSYALQAFGTEAVIGRRLRLGRSQPANIEIVGVVADAKYQRLREEPTPVVYFPFRQGSWKSARLYVRGVTAHWTLSDWRGRSRPCFRGCRWKATLPWRR